MSDNIIRVYHKEKNYTSIYNDTTRDKRLNAKERGVLVTVLSLPPGWMIRFNALVRDEFPEDGRDAIRSAFRRLIDCGYIELHRDRDEETGRYGESIYKVYEVPLHTDPVERKKSKPSKNGKSVSGETGEKPTDGKSVSGDFSAKSIDGISVYGKPDPIKERSLEIKELKIKRDDDDSAAVGLESNIIDFPKKEWNEDQWNIVWIEAYVEICKMYPDSINRPLFSKAYDKVKARLLKQKRTAVNPAAFLYKCMVEELGELERLQEGQEALEIGQAVGGSYPTKPSRKRPEKKQEAVRPYL